MKLSLHTKTIFKTNLPTAFRIASETGYDAVEIVATTLKDYLEFGTVGLGLNKEEKFELGLKNVKALLDKYNLKAVCINDICHVDREDAAAKKLMREEAEYYSKAAAAIGCPVIQLVPLCSLEGRDWKDIVRITGDNIRDIADIGAKYGVGFQLEPVAWSPVNSLPKSLELLKYVDRDNARMVIDFWHLHAGGGTTPEDVMKLPKEMIYNIHFCDGKGFGSKNAESEEIANTKDETLLRGYYPGDGEIDLKAWSDAVKATGYEGYWSAELVSAFHWEQDATEVAKTMKAALEKFA
ncbi:MAG: sugar phosphate isomerase/epimerase family protein [Anaerovoracaceae bacterium]